MVRIFCPHLRMDRNGSGGAGKARRFRDGGGVRAHFDASHCRRLLSGVVYGPTGAPLANAVLCFTPDNTDVSTTIEATTDERGFYTVALNHRAYALSIAPSKSAGIASLFTDVVITDSTPRSLDFTLRHTNLMFGRSLDDHGNARANVRAEAFTRSSSGKVTKMATAMSDEDGIFRLFVPSFDVDSAPVF